MRKNRAVITGLGVLAANGIGVEAFWQSLLEAQSGIGFISLFDSSEMPCRMAGEIKSFDPRIHLQDVFKPGRLARHTQLAIAAAQMALRDAGLSADDIKDHMRIPVVLGVSSSAFELIEHGMRAMLKRGSNCVSPTVVHSSPPQAAATSLCEILKFPSRSITLSTACASGLDAIATAAASICSGATDIAVAGGTDAPITPLAFSTFWTAGLLTSRVDSPEKASRPFDLQADSGVISEGAGIVVIENLEHALARGAKPYMEITGYGTSMDSDVHRPSSGLAVSMRTALANAGRMSEDVHYVSAHGPGHPLLDRVETEAIKSALGRHAYSIPVGSIKGCTGNPLAAGGAHQVVACALTMTEHTVPPTANCEESESACDLDYVTRGPRRADVRCAIINSHGIGGGNSSLVVEQVYA